MSCRALYILAAFLLAESASNESARTLCGAAEKSKSFLDTAVDFISKAKEAIPHCTNDENSRCMMKAIDCEELFQCGNGESGVYRVWPRNKIIQGSVEVYCDMNTDKGGWTVIQRRGDHGRPQDYFFKSWEEYKKGFGDIEKDFWLGNDLIFALTNQRLYSIRIDLKDVEGNTRYAKYDTFWIDREDEHYMLHIKDYSGNANDSMTEWHNGNKFSTKDRDNDKSQDDCSNIYKGAWWYSSCHSSNLNGLYLQGRHDSYADGVIWSTWKGHKESLEAVEMKIRPKNFRKSN